MHGIVSLPDQDAAAATGPVERIRAWLRKNLRFLLVVIAPTLILGVYLYGFAANQYESEAHFMVRAAQETPAVPTGLGQVLSLGGASQAQSEALSVGDYLTSHDAVSTLRRSADLVERFRRPEADPLSKLWNANPTDETLLNYYHRQVSVHFNSDTGIATLSVKSFRPQDSYDLVKILLNLGEQRVNSLNMRAYEDSLAVSRKQVADAESAVTAAQTALTLFRQTNRDLDPPSSGEVQTKLVGSLNENLAQSRAMLQGMGSTIRKDSPQYKAMQAKVNALESQVSAQDNHLTVGSSAIAAKLGRYEELKLQQDFAAKRYEAAAAALEKAREQAIKQQLFVVRIVEPNLPQRSLYPKRFQLLLTVFLGLLITYAIGWLIAAGVREHAA